MLIETKVTEDTPVKKVHGVDPTEAIDTEIAKNSQEKRSASGGSGGTGGAHAETSNDGDQEEQRRCDF
jgi:hypothetical protein